MTIKKEKEIKDDYLNGMKYKEIFEKYNITLSELNKIIHKYKLTRSKKELMKGNQFAKNRKGGGNPTGIKNALKTGEFEKIYKDVLTEDENLFYENYKINDTNELLINEYIEEYKLLKIREIRMLKRIMKLEQTERDMTIDSIQKKNTSQGATETVTKVESTANAIQRIEEGLTRVSEAKRKSRENMIKLGFSKRELELKEKKIESELW